MLPYLYVFMSTMFFLFLYDIREFKPFRFLLLFSAIITLSILYYFRDYSIGLDTYTYVSIMDDVSLINSISNLIDYSLSYNIEIGFLYFIYIFSFFGASPAFIFFISAFLIYSNFAIALRRIKINAVLYYASFFSYCAIFLWSFNILRQMIAISFVVLAVSFLLSGSRKFFLSFVFLASLFHYSAIICLIFYFIYKYLDFAFKYRWFLIGLIFFASKFILLAITSYYPRYANYASGEDANGIGFLLLSFYLFIFLFSSWFLKYVKCYAFSYKFFISLFSIYIGLQFSFIINGISSFGTTRILIYFLWPSVFIIGILLKNIKMEYRYILNCLIFLFLSFYFVYTLNSMGYDYVPFRFLAR